MFVPLCSQHLQTTGSLVKFILYVVAFKQLLWKRPSGQDRKKVPIVFGCLHHFPPSASQTENEQACIFSQTTTDREAI